MSSLSDINVFLFYLDINIFYLLLFFFIKRAFPNIELHKSLHCTFHLEDKYSLKMDLGKPKESMNIFYFFMQILNSYHMKDIVLNSWDT